MGEFAVDEATAWAMQQQQQYAYYYGNNSTMYSSYDPVMETAPVYSSPPMGPSSSPPVMAMPQTKKKGAGSKLRQLQIRGGHANVQCAQQLIGQRLMESGAEMQELEGRMMQGQQQRYRKRSGRGGGRGGERRVGEQPWEMAAAVEGGDGTRLVDGCVYYSNSNNTAQPVC